MQSQLPDFPLSRDERLAALQASILSTLHQPMTPAQFCQKWVNHPLIDHSTITSRRYSTHCDHALAEATGLSLWNVQRWGKRYDKAPAYVTAILPLADIVRQIQALGICRPQTHLWQSEHSNTKLKFGFGESVVADGEFGTIAGVLYLDNTWHCLIALHPDSPSAQEKTILQVPQSHVSRW